MTVERHVDTDASAADRTYATFQHLVGLLSLFDGMIIGLIGAIVMWRIKAKESPYLDDHGREAVNFQLSLLLYTIVGTAVVAIFTLGLLVIPWIGAIWILRLVTGIKAAVAANRGEFYRYPACIRLIASPE